LELAFDLRLDAAEDRHGAGLGSNESRCRPGEADYEDRRGRADAKAANTQARSTTTVLATAAPANTEPAVRTNPSAPTPYGERRRAHGRTAHAGATAITEIARAVLPRTALVSVRAVSSMVLSGPIPSAAA